MKHLKILFFWYNFPDCHTRLDKSKLVVLSIMMRFHPYARPLKIFRPCNIPGFDTILSRCLSIDHVQMLSVKKCANILAVEYVENSHSHVGNTGKIKKMSVQRNNNFFDFFSWNDRQQTLTSLKRKEKRTRLAAGKIQIFLAECPCLSSWCLHDRLNK